MIVSPRYSINFHAQVLWWLRSMYCSGNYCSEVGGGKIWGANTLEDAHLLTGVVI